LCFVGVRGQSFGPELLALTARATCLGLLAATLVAGWLVWRRAGGVMAPATLARVIGAVGLSLAVARWLPSPSRWMTPPYCALVALVYAATLVASRELTRLEAGYVLRVLGRRSADS
jgi:hypothetical protein